MGLFAKLLMLALTAGAVAGNTDELQRFYEELENEAQIVVSAMDMRSLSLMLDYDYIRKGRYPSEARFGEWVAESFKENEQRELAVDTWGSPFVYRTSDKRRQFRLVSLGPDRVEGTEDDIVRTGP